MLTALAGGALLAEKFGATPPRAIALPGWMRSATDYAPILDGLDAVAVHIPGFGVTAEPTEVWGTEEYADAVAAAIAPFGPQVIVGHSFGGRVAVRLAVRHPELVSGLVLTGAPLVRPAAAPRPSLRFRVVRRLVRAGILSQKVLDDARKKFGSADYIAAQGIMRSIFVKVIAEEYRDDLAKIAVPVRMVWGELDDAAPATAGEAAAALVPHSRFRVVPGAGHLLDAPLAAELRVDLLELLAEVRA